MWWRCFLAHTICEARCEKKSGDCKNVFNHFSCVKQFFFSLIFFLLPSFRLGNFYITNKVKHNFFLYLTLFNPLGGKMRGNDVQPWKKEEKTLASTASQKCPIDGWWPEEGGNGDLLCFLMRENFLIIFIQIFLINSLIFWTNERTNERPRWRAV